MSAAVSAPCFPFIGEQHAHGGPGSPCVRLPDETGQTRCSSQWGRGEIFILYFLHLDLFSFHWQSLMLPPSCRWTVWCCSCIASESSWRRPTASGWTSCSSSCGTASCCRRASPPWLACCCWRSWNSEREAGCWAARRTSTTTVKLRTRIVGRTQVPGWPSRPTFKHLLYLQHWFTKPAASYQEIKRTFSLPEERSSSAATNRLILSDSFLFWKHNGDVVPWMWNVQ